VIDTHRGTILRVEMVTEEPMASRVTFVVRAIERKVAAEAEC
jgi:hypothetical protein